MRIIFTRINLTLKILPITNRRVIFTAIVLFEIKKLNLVGKFKLVSFHLFGTFSIFLRSTFSISITPIIQLRIRRGSLHNSYPYIYP